MKVYVIPGDPIALARARHGQRKVYDSQKHLKLVAGLSLVEQHKGLEMFAGALHLDVSFFMGLPSNMSAVKRKALIHTNHIYRPDLSNLLKFIEDAATGILYHDDCLIASISCKKLYDENPRTEFTLKQLS